jgi:hypothetical protein
MAVIQQKKVLTALNLHRILFLAASLNIWSFKAELFKNAVKGGKKLNKQTAGVIGLVGGIISAVGVALAWLTVSAAGISVGFSGIEFLRAGGEGTGMSALVLIGGILALLGGLGMLAIKVKAVSYLLPVGGILALVGGIWAAVRITQIMGAVGVVAGVSVGIGYGIYAGIVGAILALVGSLGLKGK